MNRQEAIDVVRNNWPEGRVLLKLALEILIPELRENDDEKIRKTLKSFFDSEISDYGNVEWRNGIRYGEIVSWLEKQGTPAKLSEEEQNRFAKGVLTSCALSFTDYLDAHKYEGKMCVSNGECEDIENAFHNAMWDRLHRYYCKYIEKQGEKTNPYSGISFEYNGHIWGMCARDNGIDILLDKQLFTHLEKQGEQKPVIEMKSAEESLGIDSDTYNKIVDECIYGEQKPAEWSEEDEKMFNSIIEVLEATPSARFVPIKRETMIPWLKSLKERMKGATK